MMHLGDHLFFEPLARYLLISGYNLTVYPIKAMKFYYQGLGYKMGGDNDLAIVDLIISKVEFIPSLKRIKNNILFIDTASSKIRSPLCNDIVNKVAEFLIIKHVKYDPVPSYFYVDNSRILSLLSKSHSYIIFNNYIDSGSIRSGAAHQKSIIKFVEKLKNKTGFKVIHTGSMNDKERDLGIYGFVDVDVRGQTSINDLFLLCSLKNIIYNVSFDGFQMHLFFIQNKKSFILFRGRYLKKNRDYITNFVNPPFEYHEDVSNLIEYI